MNMSLLVGNSASMPHVTPNREPTGLKQQYSRAWAFFSPQEQLLFEDGQDLLEDVVNHIEQEPTDYSYLVFPFAKLYEGFLKDLLLHLDIITQRDYQSDHFRLGKTLSPNIMHRLGKRSAYLLLEKRYGKELPLLLWDTWREGRNRIFHYFPQYECMITKQQAIRLIHLLLSSMETAVVKTGV